MTMPEKIRSIVESIGTNANKPFLEAAMDGLGVVFESEGDAAADASKAAEDIANIDKSIGLVTSSGEALKNAQQNKVQATQNSPLATDDEKSSAENNATEKTTQIQQSTDAKVAELTEKKKAIEMNQAAKQAEQSSS